MFEKEAADAATATMTVDAKVKEFRDLYAKMQAGARWLGKEIAAWTGAREYHPRVDRDIKDFREKVEGPLDRLWSQMTEEERKAAFQNVPSDGNRT